MQKGKIKIIACKTVIEEMGELIPPDVEAHTLESGLHIRPDKLREALQAMIDDYTGDAETIILGYGLCSMGVVGLMARDSNLVVPRRDDCIGIFLGSRAAYKRELDQEPGTYFLSKGWIEAGITLLEELRSMEERYGKRRAEVVMNRMLQNYTRLAFIDMGYQDQDYYRKFARTVANELNLRYEEIKGKTDLLEKMCNGPWDDEFVVAPPGHIIRLEDFQTDQAEGQQDRAPLIEQERIMGSNPDPV